jgi:hypothetical protein
MSETPPTDAIDQAIESLAPKKPYANSVAPPARASDKTGRVLTMTEIMEGLSELAQYGDGAQRSQAYRLLLGASSSAATLPPPLSGQELTQRMVRLMKMLGPALTQTCYRRAFPRANNVAMNPVALRYDDLELPPEFKFPRNVRALYKMFPEFKSPGFPKGYPQKKGPLIQREWLKELTLKTLLHRKQKLEDQVAAQIKEEDAQLREGTDAPVRDPAQS